MGIKPHEFTTFVSYFGELSFQLLRYAQKLIFSFHQCALCAYQFQAF